MREGTLRSGREGLRGREGGTEGGAVREGGLDCEDGLHNIKSREEGE